MTPGAILAITVFSIMIGLGLTAASLAARGCWPNIAEELDIITLSNSSWRRFFLGIFNAFISLLVLIVISKIPPLGIIGLAILFLLIIVTFIGFIAEVNLWGRRVMLLRDSTSSSFAHTLAGGLTLSSILLLPFVGQMIFFIILFQSLGTSVYWLFQRKNLPKSQNLS
jgi:hypothetical protein